MTWMDSKYTDKDATCAVCGKEIPAGEPRKYDKESKKVAHGGCVNGQEQVAKLPVELKTCEACGKTVAVYQQVIDAKWREHTLCEDCNWLRKAQFGLKAAGLWRPTPPQEAQQ